MPSQSGRLRALVTVPASSSITPGEPTPTAVSSPRATPASSSASRTAPTIASATSAGPPSVGRGMTGGAEHLVVLVHHDRLDLRTAEVDAAVPCHSLSSTRWTADPRRPRFPRNDTGGSGRTAPPSTSAPPESGGSPSRCSGRAYAKARASAAERQSENVAWRATGHSPAPTDASRPGRSARSPRGRRRSRGRTGPGGSGGWSARVRMATGPPASAASLRATGAAARERDRRRPTRRASAAAPSAPCSVSRPSARQRAGISEPARNASSAASSSQTANSAQRRRSAQIVIVRPRPVPSSRQKRRPGVRRSSGRSRPMRENASGAAARG